MIFLCYDPVGKTLEEVTREPTVYSQGVSVFVLQYENDTLGKRAADGFSLREILCRHPELKTALVVSHNDFFGESVFRVRKENCIES